MHTVSISDLRANLLAYMEKASKGEHITVTTNGRVLATITPPIDKRELARKRLDELAATARTHDVTSPTGAEWDAMQ
ncbi:MAG: type II toxin-antitoxin system prevent-host-death family antitoxin [Chromatiaceae bacterium]|nr:MAG: type II toxin-antitoxin system prevent-host-death family antitoxin [Chromatiaceae bacterium]